MKRQRLAEQWDSFSREVVPRDASVTQRKETRRAFYAGALGVLPLIMHGEPTEEDLSLLRDLREELAEFAKSVLAGKS